MTNQKPSAANAAASPPHEELMGRELSNALIFFHEAVAGHLGLGAAEWKCLGLLDQHGPLTASRLAELSGFTTGAITGIADRLERAGYARRAPHPSDRRSVIVQPRHLSELKKKVAPIFQSLGQAMGEIARRYSAAELTAIGKFLRETTEVLRNETAKLKRQKQGRTLGNR